jgi:ribonuclease P protein component
MLPKHYRLRTRDANFVARRGRGISGAVLRIKWAPERARHSHASVVVGLAVDKRATVRNRLKRQLREILRPLVPRLSPPVNLMVFTQKTALDKSFRELAHELTALLRRAHLL